MGTKHLIRWIAILVTISLLMGVVCFASSDGTSTPNQDMLNAMLYGDRTWVIDTLVQDDRSTNPMAILQSRSDDKSLAREDLNQYRGIDANAETAQAAYWKMVDVMDKVYNAEEYINSFLDEAGEIVSWVAGLFTSSEDVRSTVDSLTASRAELEYDKLLKSMFTETYTATDGTTLLDTESSLLLVKQVKTTVEFLKALNSFVKSGAATIVGEENLDALSLAYYNDYALPYGEAAESFLEAFGKLCADPASNNSFVTKLTADIATMAHLSAFQPEQSYLGFSYVDFLAENIVDNGIDSLLKANGKALSYADTALDTYLFLENIRQQKEMITGPLARLADAAADLDAEDSIKHFNDLISDEYDASLLSWDSIQTYLRKNNTVSKLVSEAASSHLKKMLHLTDDYMLGAVVAEGVSVVKISSWVADRAVGLKETCKKTYELLYWEDLADLCVDVYQVDLAAYQSAPGEETAEAVLQDLMLLQRVRLYGEKIAYDLNSSPNDSWLGQLYNGGEAQEYWDVVYQYSVDELLAASVVPSMTGITVPSGQMLVVYYREDIGYYGAMDDAYYIELPFRLSGGLVVNGTLIVNNTASSAFGIGCITAGNGATVAFTGGTTEIAEFNQSGSTISLILRNDAVIDMTENLVLRSVNYESDHNLPLTTKNLELYGAFPVPIEAGGDVTASGGSVPALTLTGSGTQTVSGSLNAGEVTANCPYLNLSGTLTTDTIRLYGDRVSVTGNVNVTDTLCGYAPAISGGKKVLFSGSTVERGHWNGDLSVQNASLTDVLISGGLYDKGGTCYTGSITMKGALDCTGASSIGDFALLTVYGPAWFSSPLTGDGQLVLYGDLGTADGITIPQEVTLCGSVLQEVSGAFSVDTIHFANTGQSGIVVRNKVTVTGLLDNPTGKVDAQTPVYVADAACVASSFNGTLSVLNWTLHTSADVSGDLHIRSGGTVSGTALNVNGMLKAEGAATLDGCMVTAGTLHSLSALTLANGASVLVSGTADLGGTLTNPTEVTVRGDLFLSGLTASGALRTEGDVAVSGTTKLGALTLDGAFKQGIYGSDFTVGDLKIYNTSGRPLTLAQTITVTGCYDNPSTTVQGGTIKGGAETAENVTVDTVHNGDLILGMPLTVTDCTLVVNGAVSVESVTLVNATLTVNGDVTLTGGTTAIDEDSRMTVNGALFSASGAITLDGAMEVRGDMLLESTTMTGGDLSLGGDLYGSGALRPQSLTLSGLIRQRIGATNLHTGDLVLSNSSKGGILLEQKLYYTGTYSPGATALFNSGNLVKEAA